MILSLLSLMIVVGAISGLSIAMWKLWERMDKLQNRLDAIDKAADKFIDEILKGIENINEHTTEG